jgi:hypothetical protein
MSDLIRRIAWMTRCHKSILCTLTTCRVRSMPDNKMVTGTPFPSSARLTRVWAAPIRTFSRTVIYAPCGRRNGKTNAASLARAFSFGIGLTSFTDSRSQKIHVRGQFFLRKGPDLSTGCGTSEVGTSVLRYHFVWTGVRALE